MGGMCEAFDGAGGFSDCWILLLLRELGEFVYVSEELALYRVGNGGALGDKYAAGLRVFISLVRARYGARGETLIRHVKVGQCRRLLCKVADQMSAGDRVGAVGTLVRIARLLPSYFLEPDFRARLFLPQNIKRLRDLVALPRRAHC
jgi:hypothetical protein